MRTGFTKAVRVGKGGQMRHYRTSAKPAGLAIAVLMALLHAQAPARAQDAKFGSVEIGGFGGMNSFSQVAGLNVGTKTTLGGSAGFRVTDRALVVGEFSHVKPFSQSFAGESISVNSYLFDMGVHVQFPVGANIAPYVAGGGGVLHTRLSSTIGLSSIAVDTSGNDLQANIGGGLRFYLTPQLVFRPEFKFYKIPEMHFFRFTGGIYYQFGK
jgi:hypothetical protein